MSNDLFPEDPGATYGGVIPLKRNADGTLSLAWPGMVHDSVNSAYNALTAPGETLTGRTPTGKQLSQVPDPMQAAMDITGTMMGLGLGTSVPAGSSRIFGGFDAKTADIGKALDANEMLRNGVDPKEVWNKTGWYRDVDGQMKFEIPDTRAKINPGALTPSGHVDIRPGANLGDVLYHPDLYAAYPDMKNLVVEPIMGSQGSYSMERGAVGLGITDPQKSLSTLLHESQHAIQAKEGFAQGGSPDQFYPFGVKQWNKDWKENVLDHKDNQRAADLAGYDSGQMSNIIGKIITDRPMTDSETETFQKMIDNHPDLAVKMSDTLQNMYILDGQRKAAYNAYSNLAGEVEARNVQERHEQGLGIETPPWETQGYVPRDQQRVRMISPTYAGVEVDHNPFTDLLPVDHDPFSTAAFPVDHNPFEE